METATLVQIIDETVCIFTEDKYSQERYVELNSREDQGL